MRAKRLGDALVAPVIRPGLSSHHLPLPGSLSLRPEVFAGIVEDYVSCYAGHGFERMVLFASHGGNFEALEKIAADLQPRFPRTKIVTGLSLAQLLGLLAGMEREEGLAEGSCGGHACDFETSVMLALHPEHVCMERSAGGHVGRPSGELLEKLFRDGVTAVSPLGVLGDPTGADGERGKRYFNRLQDKLAAEVKRKLAGS